MISVLWLWFWKSDVIRWLVWVLRWFPMRWFSCDGLVIKVPEVITFRKYVLKDLR